MNNDLWYNIFLEELYKKYPQKPALIEALMDLLSIEREAAYRRLRKNVVFPVEEVVKIAVSWGISLDEIIGIPSNEVAFKAQLLDYVTPSNRELENMQRTVLWCSSLGEIPDLEYLEACNKLPRSLSSGFPFLRRLELLNWLHQHGNEVVLPFSQTAFTPQAAKLSTELHQCAKNYANVSYIWDEMLFHHIVRNIRYFRSIDLINSEEVELIKGDLFDFLDYMSAVAEKGCWLETGNKVNLYISHIHIETNYSYFYSEEVKLCMVHAFVKNEIYTTNLIMTENFKRWMQLRKRASVLISETDERSRISFFREQRELVEKL